jgi:D-threo-aldose 1-dehydrogenase
MIETSISSSKHMWPLHGADIVRNRGSLYGEQAERTDSDRTVGAATDRAAPAAGAPGALLRPAPRIGFGCAGLMRCVTARQRQRLLAEAFEQGIRHLDVARMYGLGAAEREVGRFARGRRDELVIATKFGIEPAGAVGRLGRLQAPARAAIARVPALKSALARRADAFHLPRRYDVASARASLDTSLEELGVDHVDVLFVHDPTPADRLEIAELGAALDGFRSAGLVRAWGFSGESEPCIELTRAVGAPTILQVRDDIFDQSLARVPSGQPTIAFGVLANALARILGHVRARDERRALWRQTVGVDCGRPEAVASLLLRDALGRNPTGVVLFSTTHAERIKLAADAVDPRARAHDGESLQAFRELVRAELTARTAAHG